MSAPADPTPQAQPSGSVPEPGPLIIADGSLASLVAIAQAIEDAAMARTTPPLVLSWPHELRRDLHPGEAPLRQASVRTGLEMLYVHGGVDRLHELSTCADASPRRLAAGLLDAGWHAAQIGVSRVVWPIVVCEGESVDIDALGLACDLASACSRLVTVTARTNLGVVIQTPMLDFTDEQIADLALDLRVPIRACWWWKGPHASDVAQLKPILTHEQTRWSRVLASLGWSPADEAARISTITGGV